jgi:hypothetical protein
MIKINSSIMVGVVTVKTLLEEMGIMIELVDDGQGKDRESFSKSHSQLSSKDMISSGLVKLIIAGDSY